MAYSGISGPARVLSLQKGKMIMSYMDYSSQKTEQCQYQVCVLTSVSVEEGLETSKLG